MDLYQACQIVIEQSISVGYVPTRFIQIVNASGDDLAVAISRLVLKAELLEELESQINKSEASCLTIEDLIAIQEDHFGLSAEVVVQAKARSEYFNQLRGTDNEWIKKFLD